MTMTRISVLKESLQSSMITKTLVPQIELLESRYGEEYTTLAEQVLSVLETLGYDTKEICGRYIYDYVTQLNHFMETGDYGHKDYEQIRQDIYDNREVMMDTYMPGLFVGYIITAILYEKYHLYRASFLPRLSREMDGLEVGFGEGFYLWNLQKTYPGIFVRGVDISPSAKEFAERLFNVSGIPSDGFDLRYGNIIEGLPLENGSMDYGIFAEVIEHLPDPMVGLCEMARVIKPSGIFYLSTVIDSNHMDHMVNFENPQEVERLLQRAGFVVADRLLYRVMDDAPKSQDKSVGLAYVAVREK